MIRVDCRRCKNCTGEECKLYGDDPIKAAKNCAYDGFVNYIQKGPKKTTKRKGDSHGKTVQKNR